MADMTQPTPKPRPQGASDMAKGCIWGALSWIGLFFWRLLVGKRAPIWKRSVHSLPFLRDIFTNPLKTVLEFVYNGVWYNPEKQNLTYAYKGFIAGVSKKGILLTQRRVTLNTDVDYGSWPLSWVRAFFDYGKMSVDTGGDTPEVVTLTLGGISSFSNFLTDAADLTIDEQVGWLYSLRRRFTLLMVILFIPVVIVLPLVALWTDGSPAGAIFYASLIIISLMLFMLKVDDDVRRFIDGLPLVVRLLILLVLAFVIPVFIAMALTQIAGLTLALKIIIAYFVLLTVFGK